MHVHPYPASIVVCRCQARLDPDGLSVVAEGLVVIAARLIALPAHIERRRQTDLAVSAFLYELGASGDLTDGLALPALGDHVGVCGSAPGAPRNQDTEKIASRAHAKPPTCRTLEHTRS